MNALVLSCLLCFVSTAPGLLGSEVTFSSGLSQVTEGPASGEGFHITLSGDEELEAGEDLSEGVNAISTSHGQHLSKDEKKKKKSKGKKKNKHRSKATTVLNPEHSLYSSSSTSGLTSGLTSSRTTTEDLCSSTHLGYCIHGFCKHMEGLREPVCICMKGFDGERCGIQLLETAGRNEEEEERRSAEIVQTVLVIIAVVLSIISCIAILLMTCAHYRTHKNFLAAYLGSGSEEEKLQKPMSDIMV